MTNINEGDQAFRSDSLKGRDLEMPFGGALSFLRRKYTREIDSADIVVSGIPFDMATSNRPGARFGPRALRAASVGLAELDAYPFGFDPFVIDNARIPYRIDSRAEIRPVRFKTQLIRSLALQ